MKTFPGQVALHPLDLDVECGTIHALVGHNGSGKSTLIKLLAGYHRPDPGGGAWIGGAQVHLGDPAVAPSMGVQFVHQDLALIPTLTTLENFSLSEAGSKLLAPNDVRRERRAVREALAGFDVEVDMDRPVEQLQPYERSAVAIARALAGVSDRTRLLVLDEPTAALGDVQKRRLFDRLRDLKRRGIGVLFVSHFLEEVLELADRVTVLRDGRHIETRPVAGTTAEQIVNLMLGDVTQPPRRSEGHELGEVLLDVEGLSGGAIDSFDLAVRAGEIVGLTGLIGSGYDTLLSLIYGAIPATSGTVRVGGTAVAKLSPRHTREAGVALVSADRLRLGLNAEMSVAENVTLPHLRPLVRRGALSLRTERADVGDWIRRTGVRPPDPARVVKELSGGNQQLALLAKWLRTRPCVLMVDEPTQGVDVGAKAAILQLVIDTARAGCAVVIASSDPAELALTCDRVIVTERGRAKAVLHAGEITEHQLVLASHAS